VVVHERTLLQTAGHENSLLTGASRGYGGDAR
jgi:hypothetical protein